ncbi:DUF3226 domain-containing protein [Crocosphaera sp. Alani8]|uniref:DUF3226 domain-containing protein n=1 Tax=Crocosphaera sp. Alani8 TaxID=3038952 RepID=UPI00313E5844
MSNILIVESKNDKIFLEALIKHINSDIQVDPPIFVDDYEELKGLDQAKLTIVLEDLKASLIERGIEKIGIVIDIDDQGTDRRLEMVNNCIKNVFDNPEALNNTSELIKLTIDDVTEIEIACYFTNVDNQGELETVLKAIKTKDNPHAECLNDWRKCLTNKGHKITNKDFDKFWVSIYLRYDTCSKNEQKQAGRKCGMSNFGYIMEHKSNIWDFEHPILKDLKNFLALFKTEI